MSAAIAAVWGGGLCLLYLSQRTAPPTLDAAARTGTAMISVCFFACLFVAVGMPAVRRLLGAQVESVGSLETSLYAFGLGSALLSLAVLVVALLGILHSWLLLCLLAAAAFLIPFTDFGSPLREARAKVTASAVAAILPFLALAAICAIAEPGSTDALRYHLSLPAQYLKQHSMQPLPNNFYSFWPMSVEMLYTAGLSVASENAPALIHLTFALAVLLLLQSMSASSAPIGPAVLAFTMPAVAINAGLPFVDQALSFYVIAAFRAQQRFVETRARCWAVLSGLLCSAAIATKYTGLWAAVALGLVLVLRRGRPRHLLAFLLSLAVFSGPWLIRNAYHTGNPVYPYFDTLWGRPDGDTYRTERQAYELRHIEGETGQGWIGMLTLPYYYSFKQPFLDSAIGPTLVILLPIALLVVARHRDLLLFCAAFAGCWFVLSPQARLLTPVIALMSVVMADGLSDLATRHRIAGRVLAGTIIVAIAVNFAHTLFFYRTTWDPLQRILGTETREQYLARTLGDYPAVAALNRLAPHGTVLTIGQMSSFYVRPRTFPESKFDTPLAVTLARGCGSAEDYAARIKELRITHILYNAGGIESMAWIPGEYLDWGSDGERQAFYEFLRRHCKSVFRNAGSVVYAVEP